MKKNRFFQPFKRLVSIPSCTFCFLVFLVFVVSLVGIVGFIFFLSSSIQKADIERSSSFEEIRRNLYFMHSPRILTDTLSSSIAIGSLNFSQTTFDELRYIVVNSLSKSVSHFGMDYMGLWISLNDANEPRHQNFVHALFFIDSIYLSKTIYGVDSVDELTTCIIKPTADGNNFECDGPEETVPRDVNSSIVTIINGQSGGQYMTYIYCPNVSDSTNICSVDTTYAIPIYSSGGELIGTTGFAFNDFGLSRYIRGTVPSSDVRVMILDTFSENLLATTEENAPDLILKKDYINNQATQSKGTECGSFYIESITKELKKKYDGALSNIPLGERFSSKYHFIYYVDYYREDIEGLDVVFVQVIPIFGFVYEIFVFGILIVLFTILMILSTCCSGVCVFVVFNREMKKLLDSFKKIEHGLKFEEINFDSYSFVYDISVIQKSFYRLTKKLKAYSAFLPQSVLAKERMVIEGSGLSDTTTSTTNSTNSDPLHRNNHRRNHSKRKLKERNQPHHHPQGEGGKEEEDIRSTISSGEEDDDNDSTNSRHQRSVSGSRHSSFLSSNGSYSYWAKGTRKLLKRVSEHALSQSLVYKDISIVRVLFGFEGEHGSFISFHRRFATILEIILHHYKGTLLEMTEKIFVLGFNVTLPNNSHPQYAVNFALSLIDEVNQERIGNIHISVVTGAGSVGILGSDRQKREVCFGHIMEHSQQLLEHGRRLDEHLLINKNCREELEPGKYQIETRDFVLFYEGDMKQKHYFGKKDSYEKIFVVERIHHYSNDWVYVKRNEDLIRRCQLDERLWDLLLMDKTEEILKRMKERKDKNMALMGACEALNGKKFEEYFENVSQMKEKCNERVRNLSIFIKDKDV